MARVYIGIGSNLGDRQANCLKAVQMLEEAGIHVAQQSSMHETRPWGVNDQPDFINAAVGADVDMTPEELFRTLKKIESDMGRTETERWRPRLIDLDILLYGSFVMESENLTIPHKHMHERSFVLLPLAEIAAGVIHPVLNKRIADLLCELT